MCVYVERKHENCAIVLKVQEPFPTKPNLAFRYLFGVRIIVLFWMGCCASFQIFQSSRSPVMMHLLFPQAVIVEVLKFT